MSLPTGAAAHARRSISRLREDRSRASLFGLSLALPAIALLLAFAVGPVVETVLLSFFERDLTRPALGTNFVGLDNYVRVISRSTFGTILGNSMFLALSSTALQVLIGLAIALLLNQTFRLRWLLRAAIVLPWAMPTVVAAFVFRWLLDPIFGPVNQLLEVTGVIGRPIAWLGTTATAMPTVVGAHVWKGIPFVILVFLAALQTVPRELRDAARVDGANAWNELRYIVLPHLRYIIAITLVLRFIWTFNWFDFTYLLTGGGPGDATMTLPIQVYFTAFRTFDIGVATAYATIIAAILMGLTVVFLRLTVKERAA